MSIATFNEILVVARERKGGEAALAALIPPPPDPEALRVLPDDRALAILTRCVFRAGLPWDAVDRKWDGFEKVFLGFDPARLAGADDRFWEEAAKNDAIIRNAPKVRAVRGNASYVLEAAANHGGFGRYLRGWDSGRQDALMAEMGERGSRLGPGTAQYALRFLGWDGYVLSRDVVAALNRFGLDLGESPSSKRDLARVQARMNEWRAQGGWSASQLSRLLAFSADAT